MMYAKQTKYGTQNNWRESVPIHLQISIVLLALLLLITACGQKGPLFIPDRDQPEKQAESRD
jgi:hypothetical protein